MVSNSYISLEEEKIREGAIFDLRLNYNNFELVDDIWSELNINIDCLEQDNSIDEEIDEECLKNEDSFFNYKNDLKEIEEKMNLKNLNKMDIEEI